MQNLYGFVEDLSGLHLISNDERYLLPLHAGGIQPIDPTLLDVLSHDVPPAFMVDQRLMSLGRLDDHSALGEFLQGHVPVGGRVLRVEQAVEHEGAQGGRLAGAVDERGVRFRQGLADLLLRLQDLHLFTQVICLLIRVCTVSVETARIVKEMP